MARRIVRTGSSIESQVNDLMELGVLTKWQIGKSEVIFMNHVRAKEIQDAIASHLKNLNAEPLVGVPNFLQSDRFEPLVKSRRIQNNPLMR